MSRQSHNKGFLLLEAMVTLLIVSVIVLSFISQSQFLLKFDRKVSQKLTLYRSLYTETANFSRFKGSANFEEAGSSYIFTKERGVLHRVEIRNGEEHIVIERK